MFDENCVKLILKKSQDGKRALIAFKNGDKFQYVVGELPEEFKDAQPGDCIEYWYSGVYFPATRFTIEAFAKAFLTEVTKWKNFIL